MRSCAMQLFVLAVGSSLSLFAGATSNGDGAWSAVPSDPFAGVGISAAVASTELKDEMPPAATCLAEDVLAIEVCPMAPDIPLEQHRGSSDSTPLLAGSSSEIVAGDDLKYLGYVVFSSSLIPKNKVRASDLIKECVIYNDAEPPPEYFPPIDSL